MTKRNDPNRTAITVATSRPSILDDLPVRSRRRCALSAEVLADIAEIERADPDHRRWSRHTVARLLIKRYDLSMSTGTLALRLRDDHGWA